MDSEVTERVLIDTGPLVALFCADDPHHHDCLRQFDLLHRPPVVSWPVLTEVVWLLRKTPNAIDQLFRLLDESLVQIVELDEHAASWIRRFMHRFEDIEPDLADATLVYLAERLEISSIFTIDRRDFAIYRTSDDRALTIVPKM